jgi:hypothetical protein
MMYYLNRFLYWVTYPIRALFYAPGKLFSGSRRALGISLPARVAILTFLFLIICVVVSLVIFARSPERSFWGARIGWEFWTVVTVLVILIPLVLYKTLKLWLEGDVSPFPDIDHAWKAGLAALAQQGLDLSQTPLFLILGSHGEVQEKAIFDASRLSLNVREVPQGPAALHWYANPEGVYLVCTDTSSLGRLAALAQDVAAEEISQVVPAAPSIRPSAGDSIRGTIVAGSEGPAVSDEPAQPPPGPLSSIRGTMNLRETMKVGGGSDAIGSGGVAAAQKKVIRLEQQEGSEQDRRLEYVCRLIRRVRQPLCPVNGILTLLPFGLLQRSVPEAIEIQKALNKDLSTVTRTLMIRCPVTAMVVGLENESGFRELVRRVGRDRAMGQRFGKGFSVSNPPIPERLEALCAHACGSFEDWVYALFREKDALSKPGNTKLYSLLCKIRRNVKSRLEGLLTAGYAWEEDSDQGAGFFFSGCYFAATGETEDRQAFVKGVLDKLPDQQEELEWTEAAYREDQKYQSLGQLGLAVDTLLLLGLAAWIAYVWWLRSP